MFFAAGQTDRRQDAICFFAKLGIGQALSAVNQWQLHVFSCRRARQQIEILEDEPDFAIANIGKPIAIERRNICIIQDVTARAWAVETPQNIHERGFSRTARAH